MVKHVHHNFPEPKVRYINYLFYLTNSPKFKDIQFIIVYDKEKQNILTFKRLKAVNI